MQPLTLLFSLTTLFSVALGEIVLPVSGFRTPRLSTFKFEFRSDIIPAIYAFGGIEVGLEAYPVSDVPIITKLEPSSGIGTISNITLPSSISPGDYYLIVLEKINSVNVGIPSYTRVYNQTFAVGILPPTPL